MKPARPPEAKQEADVGKKSTEASDEEPVLPLRVVAWILSLGVMRLSAALAVSLAALTGGLGTVSFVGSTVTIDLPKNFCELDRRDECSKGKCIRYDPKKFEYEVEL